MTEPIIFHDYIIGYDPWWRKILDDAGSGSINRKQLQRHFTMPGIGFNRAAFLATETLLSYRTCGQQAFVIGPRLQTMFDRTSLEDVRPDEIHLPYPAFYIATPDCPWRIWGGSTGWHNLTGALVEEVGPDHPTKKGDKGLFIYIWGAENERSTHPGDDASYWLTLNLEDAKKFDNLETYLINMLMDNSRDTTALDYAKWFRDTDHVISLPEEDSERRTKFVDTAVQVTRLIVNMCMYINSQGPEITPDEAVAARLRRRKEIQQALGRIKNPKKRKKKVRDLQAELATLATTNIVWLGKTIETSGTGRGGPRGPRRGPEVRTWVRGHWWPRLATLRAQNVAAQAALDDASARIVECKKTIADTNDPVKLAAAAAELGEASQTAQVASTKLTKVVQDGTKRRRWVQPYERNKDADRKVKSHVYQMREDT